MYEQKLLSNRHWKRSLTLKINFFDFWLGPKQQQRQLCQCLVTLAEQLHHVVTVGK